MVNTNKVKKDKWNIIIRTVDQDFCEIQDAIYSVIAQTYKSKSILLTVQSKNKDRLSDVNEFLKRFDKLIEIKVIEVEANGSRSLPLNMALDNADGEYISFLDHDDVYYPHMGEVLIKETRSTNSNFVYGNSIVVNQTMKTNELGEDYQYTLHKVKAYGESFSKLKYLIDSYIPINTFIIQRDLIGKSRFDLEISRAEDWDFIIGLTGKDNFRPKYVDLDVSEYRKTDDGTDSYVESSESIELWEKNRKYIHKKRANTTVNIPMKEIIDHGKEYHELKKELNYAREFAIKYQNSIPIKLDRLLERFPLINGFVSICLKIILLPFRAIKKIKNRLVR